MLDPLFEVIVEGDAILIAPPPVPHDELELVVDTQNVIEVLVPGYGTDPPRVAPDPVTEEAPVAVAEIVVPTVMFAGNDDAAPYEDPPPSCDAVIVHVPVDRYVTTPLLSTVQTLVVEEDHVIVRPVG